MGWNGVASAELNSTDVPLLGPDFGVFIDCVARLVGRICFELE